MSAGTGNSSFSSRISCQALESFPINVKQSDFSIIFLEESYVPIFDLIEFAF